MRSALFVLLLAAPLAAGEENGTGDPDVSDSDFDTSTPPADDAYLDESEGATAQDGDPTLADPDFDTSVPPADDSYLDEAEAESAGGPSGSTPGAGVVALAVALLGAAFLARRT